MTEHIGVHRAGYRSDCPPCKANDAAVARMAAHPTIDQAWAEAEAALPDGWIIRGLTGDGMTWDAAAGPYGRAETVVGMGETPATALRALADRLREPVR